MKHPSEMLKELIANGLSQTEIARRTNLTQPTIFRIANGKNQPTYENGKLIEELYRAVVVEQSPAA